MLRYLCVLPLLACAAERQDHEPSVEQEVAALDAKTSALHSFHLVYELAGEATPGGSLEIVYRAPDLGRARVSSAEISLDAWWIGDAAYMHTKKGWQRASLPTLESSHLLDESFPDESKALSPGVFLTLSLDDTGSAEVTFMILHVRTSVFGWLGSMRKKGGVTREGAALSWQVKSVHYRISRETGVIELAEVDVGSVHRALRLQSCEIDGALDPELTTLPDDARTVAVDSEMSRGLFVGTAAVVRELGFDRAAARHPWDERAWGDWRAFLTSLHREVIDRLASGQRTKLLERVDDVTARARALLEQGDTPENRAKIEENSARMRTEFVDVLARGEKDAAEWMLQLRSDEGELRHELLDVEREVVTAMWDEQMRKPVLSAFDEKLAAALGK